MTGVTSEEEAAARRERRKAWLAVAASGLLLAIVVFGCGGGGGGGGTGSTASGTSATGSTGTIGCQVINPTQIDTTPGVGTIQNIQAIPFYNGTVTPANGQELTTGDVVQVQLWGTNSITQQPQQVQITGLDWPANVTTESGNDVLTVTGGASNTFYTVTALYNGGSATFKLQVVSAPAKVRGLVRDTNCNAVYGATVNFYNSAGALVGSTTTGFDGTFEGSVPLTAKSFGVDASNITNTQTGGPQYFQEFGYLTKYYSNAIKSCFAPLPQLSSGKSVLLQNQIVLFSASDPSIVPPPPTGCGG